MQLDRQEAEDAIRDILFLYRGLTEYHGITGDHPTGRFKPWKFLNCTVDGDEATERLLHEGAAVALISELVDCWDGQGGGMIETFRAGVESGRFDHLPAARAAVAAGLNGAEALSPLLNAVYEEYVLAYFERLSRARA